jgi:hypothetical protein
MLGTVPIVERCARTVQESSAQTFITGERVACLVQEGVVRSMLWDFNWRSVPYSGFGGQRRVGKPEMKDGSRRREIGTIS